MKKTKMRYPVLADIQQGTLLFLLCWMVYFSSYIGRYNYSAAMGAMLTEGVLTMESAGMIGTAYFLMYGIGQLFNGVLAGKMSPYQMIFMGLFCSGIANLAMSVFSDVQMMSWIWACNGFFQSMMWPPIVRLFAEVLPEAQRAKACVHITSTTPAGTLVSYAISAFALTHIGWRGAFSICGASMLAFSFVWLIATRTLRRQAQSVTNELMPQQKKQSIQSCGTLRYLAAVGLLGLFLPAALHGAIKDGVTSWVPTFVQDVFHADAAFAAVITMVLPIINLSGAYFASYLNRRVMHNEVKTCLVLFAASTIILACVPFVMGKNLVLTMLALAITTSAMLGINTMIVGVIPVKAGGRSGNAALFSGALNAATYFGAAFASWGIGLAAKHAGWNITVLLWAFFAVIAALCCVIPMQKWKQFEMKKREENEA